MKQINYYKSPIGTLKIESGDNGIISIVFTKSKNQTSKLDLLPENIKTFFTLLDMYFKTGKADFSLVDFEVSGTPFTLSVWQTLLKTKPGSCYTYALIASQIGKPRAVRAVASAIAKNPLLILIPCHRIIRSDGSLGEYSGGKNIKEKLLTIEKK